MSKPLMQVLLASVALSPFGAAQQNWWLPQATGSPALRHSHAIATEPISGRTLIFGGITGFGSDASWEWDGDGWNQTGMGAAPSPRETTAMAADGQGGIILFGGSTGADETWRYHQGAWTRLFPATTPPSRRGHAMANTGNGILMFGGYWHDGSGPTYLNDTWEWTGSNWVQRFPQHSPSPRASCGLAHDSARDRTVLLGGAVGINPIHETWEWDGTDWTNIAPANLPVGVMGAPLAFDPQAARVVCYGGFVPDGTGTNIVTVGGCYTWDGTDWTIVTLSQPNPGVRASPLAWSPISRGLILFAGHNAPTNDTWLTGPWLGAYDQYGTGCPGPTGSTPTLEPVGGNTPRRGTTSFLRCANLPPTVTIPLFVVGFSDSWDPDGYPLPVDLGILGWPGCQQLVSDEILYWEITTSGQADQPITIPAGYPLGFTFYVQALVLYTPTGVALSNAVTGVVGY